MTYPQTGTPLVGSRSVSTEELGAARRACKRIERRAAQLAREFGHLETILGDLGIEVAFVDTHDDGTIRQERTPEQTP